MTHVKMVSITRCRYKTELMLKMDPCKNEHDSDLKAEELSYMSSAMQGRWHQNIYYWCNYRIDICKPQTSVGKGILVDPGGDIGARGDSLPSRPQEAPKIYNLGNIST